MIGGGLGGLTAAALLAKSGRKVLVAEKHESPGGFAAGTYWGDRTFDTAIHLIMGGGTPSPRGGGVIRTILEHLKVADRCELERIEPFYRAIFPDFTITVPPGRNDFIAAHREHFPAHAHGLGELMELASSLQDEMLGFPVAPTLWQKLSAPVRFSHLVRSLSLTLDQSLDRFGFDARLKSVLGVLWPYLGLPPSRVSFPVWAVMTSSFIDEGPYYCHGGFEKLVAALCEGLRRTGGELVTETAVEKIMVEQGDARGVILANGEKIAAPTVISNLDARATVRELLGGEHLGTRYRRKISRMEPSVYAGILYLPVERGAVPAGTVHETLRYQSWDHDENFSLSLNGRISAATITIPTLTDTSLAPENEHLVVVSGVIPSDAASVPEDAALQLASLGEPVIPGLRERVESSRTAEHGVRFRRLGPIYGWARSPEQIGPRGLGNTTPIRGLYLCGHWSQPGAGVRTVVLSGIRVARLVLGKRTSEGVATFIANEAR